MRLTIIILLLLTGCSSVMNGSDQRIRIKTIPPSAAVEIQDTYGDRLCMASDKGWVTVPRSRKGIYIITRAEGYNQDKRFVRAGIAPWFWGNCCLVYGGIVGMVIDFATENMWKYPEKISIELNKKTEEQP